MAVHGGGRVPFVAVDQVDLQVVGIHLDAGARRARIASQIRSSTPLLVGTSAIDAKHASVAALIAGKSRSPTSLRGLRGAAAGRRGRPRIAQGRRSPSHGKQKCTLDLAGQAPG